ncbi:acetylornithine/succinylornithine family transaminase [Megasphaera paucivorans]|uniref:Acetylornithine/N-succinyldiaminopimelate aminotransferase n=1 Tax=Megasphaera paucivorans TaxID=349095 RepID=A0A1G9YCT1_9FIRM|nr:acetylornithine/succinylornithine family transaminase [Megasphaera paucivorans]SDN06870.1 acetylornithine/N-succinyldiaminopimelate aminotransferase [Megasphaera paucivorans]
MDYKALDKEYIVNVYNRLDAVIDHGKGAVLYDVNGKEYIDLSAGIAVNIFGVCDDVWKNAVISQLNTLSHISNVFYTEPQIILAEKLCKKTGMKKVFFSNSGAEANECAIKAARKYSHDKYGNGRYTIITLKNSFHGRTMATLTACGQDSLHEDFGPFLDGFVYADANDFDSVVKLAEENSVCAIMMEVVQGEGGVKPLDPMFVHQVSEYAKAHDILVIIDEVQSGNGRTGALYAYMNYGIHPDIVSTAKAIGGGLPMGATLFADTTQYALTDHTHGSTFGGNPICAAGAITIIDRLDDAFLTEVKEKGLYIKKELESCKNVEYVSGMGLMIGVKLKKDLMDVVNECIDKGVLVLTANGLLRLLPPLNIPMDVLKKGIAIIKEVIEA